MPHIIMRVEPTFNINSHPQLTQLASIGNVVLICHVPIENYQSRRSRCNHITVIEDEVVEDYDYDENEIAYDEE